MFDVDVVDWEEYFSEDVDRLYELTAAEHGRPVDSGEPDLVPEDLDEMVPDVFLAAILSNVDLGGSCVL